AADVLAERRVEPRRVADDVLAQQVEPGGWLEVLDVAQQPRVHAVGGEHGRLIASRRGLGGPLGCASPAWRYGVVIERQPGVDVMKLLKPSSIQAYNRSLEPTIIGNHSWPSSWVVTPNRLRSPARCPQKTIIGYSMPPTGPPMLMAVG